MFLLFIFMSFNFPPPLPYLPYIVLHIYWRVVLWVLDLISYMPFALLVLFNDALQEFWQHFKYSAMCSFIFK